MDAAKCGFVASGWTRSSEGTSPRQRRHTRGDSAANHGVRKICACSRHRHAKCPHAWYFNFSWQGRSYRLSFDCYSGTHVDTRTDAEALDETRLLRAANPHLRGILVAMLDTCCRPGEILSLQWGDVDMPSRELVVRAEKATTRRARRLPMSPRLHAALQTPHRRRWRGLRP